MPDNDDLKWSCYFYKLTDYQKLIICSAMLGAIEGLTKQDLDSPDVIDYFNDILFHEQTLQKRETK